MKSILRMPRRDGSPEPSPALSDGDAASVSVLAARRRARMSVADADAAYRAQLVVEFVAARGDLAAEASLLAEAARYDRSHPDEPSLVTELCAAVEGDAPQGVAA